jgi:hypothetical protein
MPLIEINGNSSRMGGQRAYDIPKVIHREHWRHTVVIPLNIIFALIGISVAVVPGIVALHMMSQDERARTEPLETAASSPAVQLGSCPYCDEVLGWLVPLPTPGVATG